MAGLMPEDRGRRVQRRRASGKLNLSEEAPNKISVGGARYRLRPQLAAHYASDA